MMLALSRGLKMFYFYVPNQDNILDKSSRQNEKTRSRQKEGGSRTLIGNR